MLRFQIPVALVSERVGAKVLNRYDFWIVS